MGKLVMMSVLFATILIPLRHARSDDAERALKKVVIEFCWFNLAYVLALVFVVPRLG